MKVTCGTLEVTSVATVAAGEVAVLSTLHGVFTVADGFGPKSVNARTLPSLRVCAVEEAEQGTWSVRSDATCLGCVALPLSVLGSPATRA